MSGGPERDPPGEAGSQDGAAPRPATGPGRAPGTPREDGGLEQKASPDGPAPQDAPPEAAADDSAAAGAADRPAQEAGPEPEAGPDPARPGAAPRPAPAEAPAQAVMPAPPEPFGAPPVGGFHVADLLVTLRLRWKPLALAFLLPVALGFAGAVLAPTRYTAESVLLAQTTRESAGATDVTGFGPNVVAVEMLKVTRAELEILRSTAVLEEALRRAGPGGIFTDAELTGEKAVEALQRALKTEADTASTIMRVSLTLPDRERALRGLQALVAAYLDRRDQMYADESARLLNAELERYGQRIRALEAQIRQVQAENGVLDIGQDIQLAASRREELARRENALREQQANVEAQRGAAEAALAAQPGRVFASSEATNLVPGDDSRGQLARLLQERERMAGQYTAEYPGLRELDQRIAALRGAMRENARTTFSTTREVRNPNVEMLSQRVVALRLEGEALESQLAELSRQRQEAERRGAALLAAEQRLRALGREREGLEAVNRQLITREAGSRIGEEARRQGRPGVVVVQPPAAPLDGRSLRKLLAAGGIAGGLAFAGGLGLLLTLTRRVLATPDEAERGLRLPALARFGDLAPAARDLKPLPPVEDLVALLRDARVDGRRPRLVQLVATAPEDGRGELGRALAVALARRGAADVALIDLQSDGRAHLAALGSQPLEVERIPGHVLVFSTVIPNLWISYEAVESDLTNPRASREETQTLLDRLREAFGTVVLIGPAEGGSYAMRRLSAMVDANLLVVRGERSQGGVARAARDTVLGSGGALLGFAFTGERRLLPPVLSRLVA
ncbi:hypothetical protein [Pseudoroseomonas cervicalis]|uniref:GumC family protein n=1 Tax=Teichococcus cervicalis TaxID=204525 RepID=UPI0022F16A24|nr:hypothetical protein [Pseudoroseomonas cervicalis]WBV43318.1 hypothetical protein PFY06_01720 [Pseudoroseomonas cervicalis]